MDLMNKRAPATNAGGFGGMIAKRIFRRDGQ
jgi:hypothetical protein